MNSKLIANVATTPSSAENRMGAESQATLSPEARSAVISRSEDIRPSTSSTPVSMPIGRAYENMTGTISEIR